MARALAEIEYDKVDRVLKILDCDIGASECQGVLCGMLCSAKNFEVGNWLRHTLGYQDEQELQDLANDPAIQSLFQQTLMGFDSDDFSFSLLLPDDESALALRIEALGAWCRGFLSGFGLSDVKDTKQLGEDTQDYLRDLHEIGKVDPKALEADGNEEALFEVQEYARVGALLVREEFRASMKGDALANPDRDNPSIH